MKEEPIFVDILALILLLLMSIFTIIAMIYSGPSYVSLAVIFSFITGLFIGKRWLYF